jgi:hypothetical protein
VRVACTPELVATGFRATRAPRRATLPASAWRVLVSARDRRENFSSGRRARDAAGA